MTDKIRSTAATWQLCSLVFKQPIPTNVGVAGGTNGIERTKCPGIEMTWLPQRHSVTDSFLFHTYLYLSNLHR